MLMFLQLSAEHWMKIAGGKTGLLKQYASGTVRMLSRIYYVKWLVLRALSVLPLWIRWSSYLDLADLDSLFKEAAETERRMPPAMRAAKQATWPDYVKDWMGYGWTQQGETILKPTAKQIDNLDYALGLGLTMPEDDRRLVWAVCHSAAFKQRGASWTKLAKMLGLHDPRRVKQAYKDAMIRLYYQLN